MLVLQALGVLSMVLALVGAAYAVTAAALAGSLGPARLPRPRSSPSVAVLKPLHGDEPGLADNLLTFARQDYAGRVEVVCGVKDADDPALTALEAVRAAEPDVRLKVVVDGAVHGSNGKVSNLINMMQDVRTDVVVLSDSDIAVRQDYLSCIVAALEQPGVGAVTCYYFGRPLAGFWSSLSAMGVSYGFLPNVLVGVALGMARPCMGSTIALQRHTLQAVGGFEALRDVLADDYELGRAVRARGLRIVLPDFAVAHGCSERSFSQLFAHEIRWAVTVRLIDPAGHAGSFVTHPLPLAFLGAVLLGGQPWAIAVVLGAFAARACLKWNVDRAVGERSGTWWLLIPRDFLSFAVFIGSFFARSVYWRGARFGVASGQGFTRI
jgi:ceramide glucosyltransferase